MRKTIETILPFLTVLPIGFALGSFYFGSLWLTVKQLPTTTQPVRLFVSSFFLRISIVSICFYLVMDGQWERILICLLGFIIARILLVRRWEPKPYLQD